MAITFENAAAEPVRTAPLAIAILGGVTLIGAWIFQYGFGLQPCPLCLEQRYAYYFAIPLAVLLAVGVTYGASRKVLVAGFVVIAGMMLWNAGLGAYHSGVEWGWWAGPTDCGAVAGPADTGGKGVLDAIDRFVPPACDTAALRVLGLSFAGWNVLASLALAAVAFRGAFTRD